MKLPTPFHFALQGIRAGFISERNMKVHLLITTAVIVAGIALQISTPEWLVITIAIGMVFAAELLNTAIEKAIDAVTKTHPETYPDMGLPKDLAAGAVMITATTAIAIGLIIFLPYLTKLL